MSWFDLGKYTPYIWSAYGVAAVVLAANIIAAVQRTRRTRQRLRDYHQSRGDRS